ncbi:MAG TPA: alpha/beta fold hydrolase [Burkholderiaceae bacterium]|nr:alpha/beta fold hydrolase [Burkholderiaceae bacterium]
MPTLLRLVFVASIGYALLCAAMFAFQRRLQYFPDPSPMNPVAAGLARATSETLVTADGERIVAWWVAPRDAGRPVYLYLHGNGANLEARAARFARLVEDGAGLYAISWRGYGGSTGSPSEEGLLADARAAHAVLAARVGAARIVLYGESLGSTVAVMLAADAPVRALLLDSSFDSALAVARAAYPWLPVGLLLRDRFRADLVASRIAVPVLQVHCSDDPVTPLASALALQARLPHAAPLHRIEGRCHVPSLAAYDAVRVGFLASVFGR